MPKSIPEMLRELTDKPHVVKVEAELSCEQINAIQDVLARNERHGRGMTGRRR